MQFYDIMLLQEDLTLSVRCVILLVNKFFIGKGILIMGMDLTKNSFDFNKGDIREGMKLFAWDGIQDCSAVLCCVFDKCLFLKRGKCAVHVNYIRQLTDTIACSYKYLDEMQYFKIGMQIVPLYSHLLRLKLLEMSLSQIVFVNNKGIKFIHPVYKEIRQTLITIHMMWKDLEITPHIADPSLVPLSSSKMESDHLKSEEDMMLNGDGTHYERISQLSETNPDGTRKRKIR